MGKGGVGKGGVEARVYVGNLSWDTSWQTLKDHMRLAGDVAHCDVFEELDGRSKGCAVVTYRSPDAAQKAVEELSDTELDGRQIFVREDREPGKGGKGGDPTCRIYVGNLPWAVTWKELKDHFRSAGEVTRADVAFENGMEGGRSKGYGIVEFKSLDSARSAIDNFQETELLGRKILVREDREVVNPLASQISSWQLATVPGKGGFGKGFPGKGGFGGFAAYGAYDAYGGKAFGKGKGGDPGCKVFVGNLGYNVSWQDLKDHMRPVGEVLHVEIMTEGGTDGGASKGCGTVEFATYGAARRAVARLHDSMLSGRPLLVREFNLNPPAKGKGKGGKKGATGDPLCRVVVAGIDASTTEEELRERMGEVGEVVFVEMDSSVGQSERVFVENDSGSAVVEYATYGAARRALERLEGALIKDKAIALSEYEEAT